MVRIVRRLWCGRLPSAVLGHDPHIVRRCYCSRVVVFVNKKQLNRGGNGGRRRPSGRRRRRPPLLVFLPAPAETARSRNDIAFSIFCAQKNRRKKHTSIYRKTARFTYRTPWTKAPRDVQGMRLHVQKKGYKREQLFQGNVKM